MPTLSLFDRSTIVPNSGAIAVVHGGVVQLRRQALDGAYDPSAAYLAAGEYVTFPNFAGTGIVSLWGFEVTLDLNDGVVDFQLSADNGATWLYWSGAAWAAAGAGNWSTATVVGANIATFPLGAGTIRGVRVRMRLRPSADGTQTPVVRDVVVLCEFDHDPAVDVLRTIKAYLQVLRYRLYGVEPALGTDQIILNPFDFTVDPAGPFEVYNRVTDPGQQTNLFSAYDAGTGAITMTAVQAAGQPLELRYRGSCPIVLVPDQWLFISRVPSLEVEIRASVDERTSGGVLVERNLDTEIARTRWGPRFLRVVVSVTAVDKDEERATRAIQEIRRALHETPIVSRATGDVWGTAEVDGLLARPNISEGNFAPRIGVVLWVREHGTGFTQDAVATEFNFRVSGAPARTWYDEVVSVT